MAYLRGSRPSRSSGPCERTLLPPPALATAQPQSAQASLHCAGAISQSWAPATRFPLPALVLPQSKVWIPGRTHQTYSMREPECRMLMLGGGRWTRCPWPMWTIVRSTSESFSGGAGGWCAVAHSAGQHLDASLNCLSLFPFQSPGFSFLLSGVTSQINYPSQALLSGKSRLKHDATHFC